MNWESALKAHAVVSTLAILALLTLVATGQAPTKHFDHLTVRHLDVLDSENRVRVQIAGEFPPNRSMLSGILFHNQDGHEAGALVYQGEKMEDGTVKAVGLLTFDQYREDQITTLMYSQDGEQKSNGLRITDRPNELGPNMKAFYAAYYDAETPEERARLQRKMLPKVPPEERAQQRVYIGRDREGNSVLDLNDANGKPRIRAEVTPDGDARLVFLDNDGNVIKAMTPNES